MNATANASAELIVVDQQNLGPAAARLLVFICGSTDSALLDDLTRLLWRQYGEGSIVDNEAEYLLSRIEYRRRRERDPSLGDSTQPRQFRGNIQNRFVSRQRQRSPDRKLSRNRRRTLGGSSGSPDDLRPYYTEDQRSVLFIIAGEVRRRGICNLPVDKTAALAGVCRTTVQTTLHEARMRGHIRITKRQRPGRKNLTNIVEITSQKWRIWLRRSASGADRV